MRSGTEEVEEREKEKPEVGADVGEGCHYWERRKPGAERKGEHYAWAKVCTVFA